MRTGWEFDSSSSCSVVLLTDWCEILGLCYFWESLGAGK